ncbi:YacL family protein [Shewanella sp. D64]|uniref:YacL family protein n=1 Tax=unclassified Shewanella TaxID=196818 RepID=UPI0022BA3BE5|nr:MULTISPECIES: YacL family protein [unclassified Shewanella]MEC4725191.1 YacL family protein [Shewanella sp. D64]MEC4737092.1 YacL family protein [Shewanella sp. E94]WBJ96677.1 YacL family protein [Shewanella sp. MTB7]
MEYEFRRNTLTGTVMASFSMDHEALGFWLVEELGECTDKYAEICQVVAQLQSNQLLHWRMVGKALSLELDSEQARIFANELENGEEFELEYAMSLYDGESEAYCGLEDFQSALDSWHTFLNETH